MSSFKCASGHEWKIPRLSYGLIRDIESETNVNIYKAAEEGGKLVQLLFSPFTIAGVLWVLCKEQAGQRGIDEKQFAYGLTGEAIEKAGEAMMEAVIDFFPRAKVSQAMKASLRGKMEAIDDGLVARLNSMPSGLPVSPESTPNAGA